LSNQRQIVFFLIMVCSSYFRSASNRCMLNVNTGQILLRISCLSARIGALRKMGSIAAIVPLRHGPA